MGKEIHQNDSVNQVALINSDGNQININNDPVQYMSKLIQQGKGEEAVELFKRIYKEMGQIHPSYPMYSYSPRKIGTKVYFEHTPANKEVAEKYPLNFKGKLTIDQGEMKSGETLNDLFLRKYFSQENISIDISAIETWIGVTKIEDKYSLEQQAANSGEWFISPQELPSPIKAKLVMGNDEWERVVLDYLELGISAVDNTINEMVISNVRQENALLHVYITMPSIFVSKSLNKENFKFHININEKVQGKNIRAEKLFLEFVKYINESSIMNIMNVENQEVFLTSRNINSEEDEETSGIEEKIAFLEELISIEEYFDVDFKLPDYIKEEDLTNIEILKAIKTHRSIEFKIKEFNIPFDDKERAEKFVNDVEGKVFQVTTQEEVSFKLFGVEFDQIEAKHTFEKLEVKNIDRLKNKIRYFDEGDTINIPLVPKDDSKVISYYSIQTSYENFKG